MYSCVHLAGAGRRHASPAAVRAVAQQVHRRGGALPASRRRLGDTPRVERPKARSEAGGGVRDANLNAWGAALLGVGALLGGGAWAAHAGGRSLGDVVNEALDAVSSAATASPEILAAALPPLSVYSHPESGVEGVARGPVIVRRPVATLVLGWEGTAVDIVYDPKAGYLPVPRPGFVDLLLVCADANVEVALWSVSCSSATLEEQVHRLVTGLVVREDSRRYDHFAHFLLDTYNRSKAFEAAAALAESRPPRPLIPMGEEDIPAHYARCVLRVEGVVGKEACHAVEGVHGGRGRDIELLTAGRKPGSVLVVLREEEVGGAVLPGGCASLPVPSFSADGGGGGGRARDDPTLMLLSILLSNFAEASGGGEAGGATPRLSIRQYVDALEEKARERGSTPRTGKPVETTVAILRTVVQEEKKKLKEKREAEGDGAARE